jgi:acyl carrier protein
MTDAIRREILAALAQVAPEADLTSLDPRRPIREQVDVDSYDLLQFLVGIDERLKVSIPEQDYDRVQTLEQIVSYVATRVGSEG